MSTLRVGQALRPVRLKVYACQRTPAAGFSSRGGQATVEYLIVALALMAIIVAIGLLAAKLGEGMFVQHAADSASHALTTNTAGSVGDVLLY